MSDYNVNVNRGPRIDPEKARAFVKGFNEGDPDAGRKSAIIFGSAATGAAIGSVGGLPGAIVGGTVGLTGAVGYLIYEQMTEKKSYKGGR